jgi:hypothetical protein
LPHCSLCNPIREGGGGGGGEVVKKEVEEEVEEEVEVRKQPTRAQIKFHGELWNALKNEEIKTTCNCL